MLPAPVRHCLLQGLRPTLGGGHANWDWERDLRVEENTGGRNSSFLKRRIWWGGGRAKGFNINVEKGPDKNL